jgi:hypothetical protein
MSKRASKRALDGEPSARVGHDGEAETTTARRTKRLRDTEVSDTRKKGADVEEDDGEDHSVYDEEAGLEDGTSEEETESESEDAALERISKQQKQQEETGQEDTSLFEAGVILRVYMENFMCHRLLDLELGKYVNFITGDNGSGEWIQGSILL